MMGLPTPTAPLASSTLQVLERASTKTDGSLAMTGEMVLKKDLTGMADEGPPAARGKSPFQVHGKTSSYSRREPRLKPTACMMSLCNALPSLDYSTCFAAVNRHACARY